VIFKQINAGHVLILTGPGPTASDSNFQTGHYVLEPTVTVSALITSWGPEQLATMGVVPAILERNEFEAGKTNQGRQVSVQNVC
jgi:hypothetical protein